MQTVSQVAISEPKNESGKDVAILQTSLQKLQQDFEAVNEKKLALQKVNNNLETSLNKFVLLHTDEKNEKKERIEKHDLLLTKYHSVSMKLYLLLGIGFVLAVLAIGFNISTIQEFVRGFGIG